MDWAVAMPRQASATKRLLTRRGNHLQVNAIVMRGAITAQRSQRSPALSTYRQSASWMEKLLSSDNGCETALSGAPQQRKSPVGEGPTQGGCWLNLVACERAYDGN